MALAALSLVGCATSGASEGGAIFDALDGSMPEAPDGIDDSEMNTGTSDGERDAGADPGRDGAGGDGSSGDGASDGASDGADGDGAGGDGASGDGSSGVTCDSPLPTSGTSTALDDMNDGNGTIASVDGRNGSWYVADDGTASALAPSTSGGDLQMTLATAGDYVAKVTGGPYSDWGASVGFDLRAAGGSSCAYDLSAYSGVRFRAKGSGSARFVIRTTTTDADSDAYDGHGGTITLGSSFASYVLCFAGLTQEYGTVTTFTPSEVKNLNWQFEPGKSVSFTLDDVELVSGSCSAVVAP